MVVTYCAVIMLLIVAYLLGSIPSAVWIGKHYYGVDIREHGSRNAGATNMLRVLGLRAALPVFVIDFFKGFLAVSLMGLMRFDVDITTPWVINLKIIAVAFAVLGHIFPVFASFKGGKGVATASVMILCLNPIVFLIIALIFVIVAWSTKYISLGSIISVMLYPLLLFKLQNPALMGGGGQYIIIAFIVACLVVFKHRENIKLIMAGNENKLVLNIKKKTNKEETTTDCDEKSEDK